MNDAEQISDESPTPNMVELHFMNNFMDPIMYGLRKNDYLDSKHGAGTAAKYFREILSDTRKNYAEYWQREVDLINGSNKSERLKEAIAARHKEIAPVIARIDAIIKEMREISLKPNVDTEGLRRLANEFNQLSPENRTSS